MPASSRQHKTIHNSLIFNDDDSAYLSRTFSTPTLNTKWTHSFWIKRTALGSGMIISANSGNNVTYITFAGDKIGFAKAIVGTSTTWNRETVALFRDVGAWYHVVIAFDSTLGSSIDRGKVYVNGDQVTITEVTGAIGSSETTEMNSALAHLIAADNSTLLGLGNYLDHYLAETHFIDGQALTPFDFGETDPATGQWVPKDYEGTYGTNGFYLDFADGTSTTTLGEDKSGNANNWTLTGMATTDQTTDTPTNNYCTLNAISAGTGTLSEGNLKAVTSVDQIGTLGVSSGKWAWEITANANGDFGIVKSSLTGTESVASDLSGEAVEMVLDMDAGTLKKRVNGGSLENIDLALDTTATYLPLMKGDCTCDFGQKGFTPTDTGFKALNTRNLPKPAITLPGNYFKAVLRTGNATASTVSESGFATDLAVIKNRDQADDWKWVDTARGATQIITSASSNAESTDSNGVTSFVSNGFNVGTGANGYNDNAEAFVDYHFKEDPVAGFDIVLYAGTGTTHAENHSLNAVPDMMIVKNRDFAGSWPVYHAFNTAAPETDTLVLNLLNASTDQAQIWGDTAPTASQFTVGTANVSNRSGDNMIAFLFSSKEGFSKFGSYTGTGTADGAFVYTGFRPAFVLCKSSDSTSDWHIYDDQRVGYNADNNRLNCNDNTAEGTVDEIDFLSNGFKLRIATDPNVAESYIYAAFAESPFKYSNAR